MNKFKLSKRKFTECTSNPEPWVQLLGDPPGSPQTTGQPTTVGWNVNDV